MATHALDMFSCGQIIHWLASSVPIWGMEEATEATMTHMLCQESEFTIRGDTFTLLPVYHLVVELLRKEPTRRLTLKKLRVRVHAFRHPFGAFTLLTPPSPCISLRGLFM